MTESCKRNSLLPWSGLWHSKLSPPPPQSPRRPDCPACRPARRSPRTRNCRTLPITVQLISINYAFMSRHTMAPTSHSGLLSDGRDHISITNKTERVVMRIWVCLTAFVLSENQKYFCTRGPRSEIHNRTFSTTQSVSQSVSREISC